MPVQASMIVDTSPLIAIPARAIENRAAHRASAANFMEAAVIIDASRDPIASRRSDDLIKEAQDANNQSHAFLPWMSCS
jgi:ribonuclease VapC